MIDSPIPLGVAATSREPGLERRIEELVRSGVTWLQIYLEPDTSEDITFLKGYPLNVIVHAAHESHGFNFCNGATELNRRVIDEAESAAACIGARFIVVHPGYVSEEQRHAGLDEHLLFEKTFDGLTEYIVKKIDGRHKVLVENMPSWVRRTRYLFANPVDAFYGDMEDAGFGFCLDLASAAITANCSRFFGIDPPPDISLPEDYEMAFFLKRLGSGGPARENLQNHARFHQIKAGDFLYIMPEVVHMRGVSYWDVMRRPRPMTDLNRIQLQIIGPYCKAHGIPIILESQPPQQMLDIAYVQRQLQALL